MIRRMSMEYTVVFSYDEEAKVWCATSKDVIGLVLESESYDELLSKVKDAVPELLELNGQPQAKVLNIKSEKRQLVYA